MPGPGLDGKSVYELLRDEKVTMALGVPTVWLMLLQHAEANALDPKADLALRQVVIGGSAAPRAMSEKFESKFGAFVVHAWGMTEMSPLGTVCRLLGKHDGCNEAQTHQREILSGAEQQRDLGEGRGEQSDEKRGHDARSKRCQRRHCKCRTSSAPPRHLIAVKTGHHRRGLARQVDQDRRRRAAVLRAVVDAGQHDERRNRLQVEGDRQQHRHRRDGTEAGQHAD